MNEIHTELIQFFKEQKAEYNFLLHRTKKEKDAVNILKNGLYFQEQLTKVTDPLSEVSELSLIGNRIFFHPYGSYIVIIAIPKNIKDYEQIVEPASRHQLKEVLGSENILELEEMYKLSPAYIMAYNTSFGKKLHFNRNFFKFHMKMAS